jgi:tetraacyldisaccharide 4'-kinase
MNLKKIKADIFLYVKEIIDKKRRNIFLIFILSIISVFFRFLVFVKNLFFDLKILKVKKVKSKVISIGNIVVGGVGKTPFLILLAKKLQENNLNKKIAIISRGYKSKFENKNVEVEPNSDFDASEIGDEPFLIKNHLKNIHIFVGKDKYKSAIDASKNFDIVLIDDGFQYRKLKKDLEIVILNSKNLFGNNKFLPNGYLREHPKSLKRADFIVVNHSDGKSMKFEEEIKKYSDKPIIYVKPKANKFYDFSKNEYDILKNTKVAIYSGIANPEIFYKTIKDLELEIVNFLFLLDHEKILENNLNEFIKKSLELEAEFILTTEKDFVKLDCFNYKIPILYLDISLNVTANNDNFSSLIEKINQITNN